MCVRIISLLTSLDQLGIEKCTFCCLPLNFLIVDKTKRLKSELINLVGVLHFSTEP